MDTRTRFLVEAGSGVATLSHPRIGRRNDRNRQRHFHGGLATTLDGVKALMEECGDDIAAIMARSLLHAIWAW